MNTKTVRLMLVFMALALAIAIGYSVIRDSSAPIQAFPNGFTDEEKRLLLMRRGDSKEIENNAQFIFAAAKQVAELEIVNCTMRPLVLRVSGRTFTVKNADNIDHVLQVGSELFALTANGKKTITVSRDIGEGTSILEVVCDPSTAGPTVRGGFIVVEG